VKSKILIIDDEATVRESLQQMLNRDFFVFTADCAREAKLIWQKESFDLVLFDILLPDSSGIELLQEFRKSFSDTPVIMITGTREVRTAVSAMKLGAYDYLTKPFSFDELIAAINGAIKLKQEKENVADLCYVGQDNIFFGDMVGRCQKMLDVFKRIAQLMHTSTTVLIQGESGTGKELIARAIHFHGLRREKQFVPVHIASLSENLLESELFGHEKGSFTGAINAKKGTLEMADGGTLFLDEVGDIPLSIQVKLLRVIQEREFRRVGGTKDIKIDVRFIAATNKDLWSLVQNGKFREDLFYRISVVPLNAPSLRERVEDIPLLAYHFLEKLKRNINKNILGITNKAMEMMEKYKWPGNVREMENVIAQSLHIANNQWIDAEDLPASIQKSCFVSENTETLEGTMSGYERKIIEDALVKSEGVVGKAADLLGTTRRVLKYKIDKHGIALSK
jgi:two-component system response regulator PilR (NtrC family)